MKENVRLNKARLGMKKELYKELAELRLREPNMKKREYE
jgi:hypothetical protein